MLTLNFRSRVWSITALARSDALAEVARRAFDRGRPAKPHPVEGNRGAIVPASRVNVALHQQRERIGLVDRQHLIEGRQRGRAIVETVAGLGEEQPRLR